MICQADPERGHETKEDKIARLYNKDIVKKQIKNEMVKQKVYKDHTFKPKINDVSARIAPDTSIIERSMNQAGVQRKEQIKQEMQK